MPNGNIKYLVGAFCLAVAIFAGTGAGSHEGANGVVKERMAAMKDMGSRMKALAAMVRGRTPFDAASAKEAADAIAAHARDMPRLFPNGSRVGPSEAVERIWTEWPAFEAEAKLLADRAGALGRRAETATTGADLRPAFGDIGRSCKSCHKNYRERNRSDMNRPSPLRPGTSRRNVLRGLMATASIASLPLDSFAASGASNHWRIITARPGHARLLGATEAPRTKIWGYDGSVPGPLLRYRQGDTVRVRLENQLPDPTSIHWHGIAIDNRMDGVVGLTQAAVGTGERFDYEFTVPDAGTFWYHTHNQSWEQMARGLYGVLIVDERDAPSVDQDLLFVIDDWRLRRDGQIDLDSFGDMHDWAHAGRLGNRLTVNGSDRPQIPVKSGDRIRLRLVNTANARLFRLDLRAPDHSGAVVAVDGFPLASPQTLRDAIELAPGQRVDLILDMAADPGAQVPVREISTGRSFDCAYFVYDSTAKKTQTDRPITALPAWRDHKPIDLAAAREIDLHMTGGAMGMMPGGMRGGRMMPMGPMVDAREVWAFNGLAGDLDRPLATVRRGEHVLINIWNETRWPHGMHLHGHHFQVVRRNGAPMSDMPWRDTELLLPMEQVTLGFVSDNPGKWLFHCHMLEHQAGGMKTWIDVRA